MLDAMTVTTRRERREHERRRREKRKAGGPSGPSPRRISQIWVLLGVVLLVIAFVLIGRAAGVFEAPPPPVNVNSNEFDPTGQTIGTRVEDLGNAHIPTGQKGRYNTVPPTSGEHWAAPAAPTPWGIKDTTLPNEVTTHNLEHGGVVIAYNDLGSDDVGKLKSLVAQLQRNGFPKVVLEPYPDLKDAKVALTAWRWILKLPNVDQGQVVRFFRAHYDSAEAPEQGAQ